MGEDGGTTEPDAPLVAESGFSSREEGPKATKVPPPTAQDRLAADAVRTSQMATLPHITQAMLKIYQDSAAQGSPYHVFFLGFLHEQDNSLVSQDLAEARRYYTRAVDLGYSLASVFLYDLDHR
jgi:TPR repeat protein